MAHEGVRARSETNGLCTHPRCWTGGRTFPNFEFTHISFGETHPACRVVGVGRSVVQNRSPDGRSARFTGRASGAMVNAFAICAPALLASMDTKTSNDTQARARAWDRYRSYMTRVPPNVGDAGAIFDEGASASLPPYGLEIEFIAGGGQTVPCEYTRESYLAVARHVIAMDGVGLAEGTTVADHVVSCSM